MVYKSSRQDLAVSLNEWRTFAVFVKRQRDYQKGYYQRDDEQSFWTTSANGTYLKNRASILKEHMHRLTKPTVPSLAASS